jgi:hypothetical protein
MRKHWVQIHEVAIKEGGDYPQSVGTMQHLFAAVTCSKRCAIAVLVEQLPAEDLAEEERQSFRKLFTRGTESTGI